MNNTDSPRLLNYLNHILQAISRIRQYVGDMNEVEFAEDHKTQDAVIRNFEFIGEASRNVETRFPEFAAQHHNVPWGVAYEMRNVLAHGYFKVDIKVVWRTIAIDLPQLEKQINGLISGFDS